MEKEQLYEYAGRLRRELHALVDQHMDDFVKRIGDGNLSSKTVMACSLAGPDYFFKGKKPVSVVLPGGEERPCKTWREAVSMILKDCNADAEGFSPSAERLRDGNGSSSAGRTGAWTNR